MIPLLDSSWPGAYERIVEAMLFSCLGGIALLTDRDTAHFETDKQT